MIYIIKTLDFKHKYYQICKIGYSTDVEKRLKDIQTHCPYSLRVYKTYTSTLKDEAALHSYMKEKKFDIKIGNSREWYRFSEVITQNIEIYLRNRGLCETFKAAERKTTYGMGSRIPSGKYKDLTFRQLKELYPAYFKVLAKTFNLVEGEFKPKEYQIKILKTPEQLKIDEANRKRAEKLKKALKRRSKD